MRDYLSNQLNARLVWHALGWRLACGALIVAIVISAGLLHWEGRWPASTESTGVLARAALRAVTLLILAWVSFAGCGSVLSRAGRVGAMSRRGLWARHSAEDQGSRLLLAARLLHGNDYVYDVAQWRVLERPLREQGSGRLWSDLRLAAGVLLVDSIRWRLGEWRDGFDEPALVIGASWRGLIAGDFERVRRLSMRARLLSPESMGTDCFLGHAELLSGNVAAAEDIYRRHMGCVLDRGTMFRWEELVLYGFDELQRAGRGHPEMSRIAEDMRAALVR